MSADPSHITGHGEKSLPLWNGISAAISINKKSHSHQRFRASKCGGGLPKWNTTCGIQQMLPPSPHGDCWGAGGRRGMQKQPFATPGRLFPTRKQGLAPDSWGAYERNEFGEPRGLHLPLQRRMLNSLTWYLIFLTSQQSLMFRLPAPFVANLYIALTPLPASLEQFSQRYWDAVS